MCKCVLPLSDVRHVCLVQVCDLQVWLQGQIMQSWQLCCNVNISEGATWSMDRLGGYSIITFDTVTNSMQPASLKLRNAAYLAADESVCMRLQS